MELFAMLDELVYVFNDIFREGRGQQAAIPERAMAEFGAALAPGDDLVSLQNAGGLSDDLLLAGEIAVGNFAVIEDRLHLLRSRRRAQGESDEWGAAGVAGDFLAQQVGGSQSRARVPR